MTISTISGAATAGFAGHVAPTWAGQYDPIYAVWLLPGATEDLRGIHVGPGSWVRITSVIPGGSYRTGVDRLRRVDSIADGLDIYRRENARRAAPTPPRFYWWP